MLLNSYTRSVAQKNLLGEEFYNYNDEKVTVVPASEVLQDRTGSDANPALLCYARKGWNLIDSLHREILEHGSPEVKELVLV